MHVFSERFECQTCRLTYEVPQPRLFSFNNPFGACPTCHGFGNIIELDLGLVVPDQNKSIQQGAIEPWTKTHYRGQLAELKRAAKNGRCVDGHPVEGPERRREALRHRRGWPGLRRHPRVLSLARAQEVQGPRARLPQPVPWVSDVPGLRRRAPAARGPRRPCRRPHDRSGVVGYGSRGAAIPAGPAAHREGNGQSVARCSRKFRSA